MSINVLDGTGGYDGKVSPRYLQRVVNRIVKYITDVTATPVDSRPYKVYTALLTQVDTDAPTAIVLENTLGSITFSYSSEGFYSIDSSELFTVDKTTAIPNYLIGVSADYKLGYVATVIESTSQIGVKCYRTSTDLTIDSFLNKHFIEIRVYN